MNFSTQQSQAVLHYKNLQDKICGAFEDIEKDLGSHSIFEEKNWNRAAGGGGSMRMMRGQVFEKVGVNISTVHGKIPDELKTQFSGYGGDDFWASGISLVAHMKSPMVPSIHMNTRMIITDNYWFGGGMDLTPTIEFDEDTEYFHASLKTMCEKHDQSYYPKFKQWCDDYFFIKHRKQARGVGGIFYDYLNNNNWGKDFDFNVDVGECFLTAFLPLITRRYKMDYLEDDKQKQLYKRALYAEFNLVYDRGTKFGLLTDGNIDAILMSLPPLCAWK